MTSKRTMFKWKICSVYCVQLNAKFVSVTNKFKRLRIVYDMLKADIKCTLAKSTKYISSSVQNFKYNDHFKSD